MSMRYRKLGATLGEGSYKTVTKAIDEEEGKEVAYNEVKIRKYEEETHAGNSFSKEIALLKNINHPNILKILDYWFTEDNFVFITELMTGGTLRDYITKVGPLNEKLIRKWGRQILEGLNYLHNLDPPIIHRDIKNENIFVNSSQGEIKIGDLGIARERKYKRYTIVGTPNFMAREMFEGDGYSEKVDIYAFGMCLLEMAIGTAPYSEFSDSNEVYRCVLQGILPGSLSKVENGCLRSLIMSCLAPQSERLSAGQCLAHHFFDGESKCTGGCATEIPVHVFVPLTDRSGKLELTLLSFSACVITFQLMLRETMRFIKFDYDLDVDTLDKVSTEMLEEKIIEEGNALANFRELLERGVKAAVERRGIATEATKSKSRADGVDMAVSLTNTISSSSAVSAAVLFVSSCAFADSSLLASANAPDETSLPQPPSPSPGTVASQPEAAEATSEETESRRAEQVRFEFGEKTIEVMKEIDAEMRAVMASSNSRTCGACKSESVLAAGSCASDHHDAEKRGVCGSAGLSSPLNSAPSGATSCEKPEGAEKEGISSTLAPAPSQLFTLPNTTAADVLQSSSATPSASAAPPHSAVQTDAESATVANNKSHCYQQQQQNILSSSSSSSRGAPQGEEESLRATTEDFVSPVAAGAPAGISSSCAPSGDPQVLPKCIPSLLYSPTLASGGAGSVLCGAEEPSAATNCTAAADQQTGSSSRAASSTTIACAVASMSVGDSGNLEPAELAECYAASIEKYKKNCPLSQFVLDAARMTARSEEVAKSWLKSLREESLETVFDLKILAYEDWARLPLTVFSCRVMQNMLYGMNNTPLREKQLPMSTDIAEFENKMAITDFLDVVCSNIIGRGEVAASWANRLLAQDIRTVGELRSLHEDDWVRLGLPVFGYRVLRNVVYQRGKVRIAA